jgi:hypothetical protein
MLLSLWPQLRLWHARGAAWQGVYAYNDLDEVAYAAYLNALINNKARRHDPYTARPDAPESIFSVQFATPYAVAAVARLCGLDAGQAMILLAALAGVALGLALFWLLAALTGDERWACAGALIVVCCGTLACAQGAFGYLRGGGPAYPFLPAFRRYVPAGALPVWFMFAACVWRALQLEKRRLRWLVGAGLCFAFLVFSYFYLWTMALAWLVCLAALWLAARRAGGRVFVVLGAFAAVSLTPYFWLLARRAADVDAVQLLTHTHAPDLSRVPAWLGLAAVLALLARRVEWRAPAPLFTAAFALTPLLVFNQQIVTGLSLQPIHYEVFGGNYVAALALVLSLTLKISPQGHRDAESDGATERQSDAANLPRVSPSLRLSLSPSLRRFLLMPLCLFVSVLALAWGVYEAQVSSAVLDEANAQRDAAQPVLRQLEAGQLVYTPDFIVADEAPTVAPAAVLWARHLHIFTGATWAESRERFYHQLYWSGMDADGLREELRGRNFAVIYALFGWGRLSDRLTIAPQPLTDAEIEAETARYAAYLANFNRDTATRFPLSHVILPARDEFSWARLDAFYQRDAGQPFGAFILYRVRLK